MNKNILTDLVDELSLNLLPYDEELKEGFKYLENEALKRGITFYDMVYLVLSKYDTNQKAREWLRSK